MKIVGMIPVRLESQRLPRKAMEDICGMKLIEHVYHRTKMSQRLDDVYVVTDSNEVKELIESINGKVIMTRSNHQTGSDRLAEAASKVECDIVVNIQGDEALVDPNDIDKVIDGFLDSKSADIAILVIPYSKKKSPSDIKVVLNKRNEVMYLSRADIPSDSRVEDNKMLKAYHIIPFKKEFLLAYSQLEKSPLEKIEFNEYLRVLENGYKIQAVFTERDVVSVDTLEDLEFVRSKMPTDEYFAKYSR